MALRAWVHLATGATTTRGGAAQRGGACRAAAAALRRGQRSPAPRGWRTAGAPAAPPCTSMAAASGSWRTSSLQRACGWGVSGVGGCTHVASESAVGCIPARRAEHQLGGGAACGGAAAGVAPSPALPPPPARDDPPRQPLHRALLLTRGQVAVSRVLGPSGQAAAPAGRAEAAERCRRALHPRSGRSTQLAHNGEARLQRGQAAGRQAGRAGDKAQEPAGVGGAGGVGAGRWPAGSRFAASARRLPHCQGATKRAATPRAALRPPAGSTRPLPAPRPATPSPGCVCSPTCAAPPRPARTALPAARAQAVTAGRGVVTWGVRERSWLRRRSCPGGVRHRERNKPAPCTPCSPQVQDRKGACRLASPRPAPPCSAAAPP